MRKVFISLLALATLASCTQNEFEEQITDNEKVEVKLASTVADIEVGTRAPIVGVSSLAAQVLLSKTPGNYISSNLLHNGTMTFTSATAATSFATPQYYPADGSPVYLCGLYPSTSWIVGSAAATTATYTFDGKTDVMAAAEKTSTKVQAQASTFQKLEFKHLLTKVIVKAVVEGNATAVQNAWGNITSIELSEAGGSTTLKNKVAVNLKAGTAPTVTAFSGATAPKFYKASGTTTVAYTDNLFSTASIAIPSTETAIAYSMVAPVAVATTGSGNNEFKLKITTEKHPTAKEVSIDLTPANGVTDLQGRECVITLKFKATEVKATASVAAWTAGGTSNVEIQ